jgi:hypothetical protein
VRGWPKANGSTATGKSFKWIQKVLERISGPQAPPSKSYDYAPHAEGKDFDDSGREPTSAASLQKPRSKGKICFNWYHLKVSIPENIGSFGTAGFTAAFEPSRDNNPRARGRQSQRSFNAYTRCATSDDRVAPCQVLTGDYFASRRLSAKLRRGSFMVFRHGVPHLTLI